MEALNKVIFLKAAARVSGNTSNNVIPEEAVSIEEEECLIEKAKRVLNDMENLWEINHGAVELRDEFHLLRYYLTRLPKRRCEDNTK